MKCSYATFGEQNKTDNDSKCATGIYIIAPKIYYMGEERAVFLIELYEDARQIMETVGEQMPNY